MILSRRSDHVCLWSDINVCLAYSLSVWFIFFLFFVFLFLAFFFFPFFSSLFLFLCRFSKYYFLFWYWRVSVSSITSFILIINNHKENNLFSSFFLFPTHHLVTHFPIYPLICITPRTLVQMFLNLNSDFYQKMCKYYVTLTSLSTIKQTIEEVTFEELCFNFNLNSIWNFRNIR